jgi:hypothetical protein
MRSFACIVASIALLGAVAASGSARTLSLTTRTFRATFLEMTFREEAEGGIAEVECPVTLEGSFHSSTIAKVVRTLIGYITRVENIPAACSGGTAVLLSTTLPWHIRYDSFAGTLPNITSVTVQLIDFSFLMRVSTLFGVVECLYRSTTAIPTTMALNRNAGAAVSTLSMGGRAPLFLRLAGSRITCREAIVTGPGGRFAVLNTTTVVTLALI